MNLPTLILSSFAALGIMTLKVPDLSTGHTPSEAALSAPQPPTQGGHPSYSVKSLREPHGFSYSGSHKTLGPIASSGRMHFDGRGNMGAEYTTVVNGVTFTGSFTGTYTVNPDGTGSIVVFLPWLNTHAHGNFVLVDDANGSYFTSTDPGYSVTGSTRKQ